MDEKPQQKDVAEILYPMSPPIEGDKNYKPPAGDAASAEEKAAAEAAEAAATGEQSAADKIAAEAAAAAADTTAADKIAAAAEAAAAETTAAGEQSAEEIAAAAATAAENAEAGEKSTAEGAESSEENQPEGDKEEDAGETISSFSELVEHMNWDADWANQLTMTTKVDGEESTATIAEMRDSFQTQEAASKRLDDAKTKVQEGYATLNTVGELVKKQLVQSVGLMKAAEQLFGLDAAETNLAALREAGDDAAYLVAKDTLAEQRKSLDAVKSEAVKALESAFDQRDAPLTEERRAELVAVERTKLVERIPSWQGEKNKENSVKEATELFDYLTTPVDETHPQAYGFTEEQVRNALGSSEGVAPMDHRFVDMARKAMLYDRQQVKVQAAKKTVVRIPLKVTKPGGGGVDATDKKAPRDAAEVLYGRNN